ncbi:hypothetical protein [Micromonospora parathelypteridis]|uniref:Vacuolar-type H+-ATPase subunit H n=1 Tax=Micromonospora parathelypteridis TaxID=1839617 RepID=A0A840VX94_9ACTN|nr:hypothetical protein [Micromonospora parathelypteridis]MBB5476779.1 vacuolar-type H+-ATPase subunit H [Micromonospora parathelypteridis]GGO16948.1 hypothetical protein GCM10011576_30390 [Micromonospora parathelypteridis]
MSVDPSLKKALRQLRNTRARRPADLVDPAEFAAWRDAIAEALEEIAAAAPDWDDRLRDQAYSEAKAARAQAVQIRSTINRSDDHGQL